MGNSRVGNYDIGAYQYTENTDNPDTIEDENSYTDEDTEVNTLEIYPNPAKDHIYITNLSSETNIKVYTILGQLILKETIYTTETTISITNWTKGVYLLMVNGSTYTFIKE